MGNKTLYIIFTLILIICISLIFPIIELNLHDIDNIILIENRSFFNEQQKELEICYKGYGAGILFAQTQNSEKPGEAENPAKDPAADCPNGENSVLVKVMIITLIVWLGLSAYIFYLNRKVKNLENMIDEE